MRSTKLPGTIINGSTTEDKSLRAIETFFDNPNIALSKHSQPQELQMHPEERYDIERNIEPLWENLKNF